MRMNFLQTLRKDIFDTCTQSATSGLTFTAGSNGSASMTVTGTLANLNAALNGLIFAQTAGYSGSASLAVTIKNSIDNLSDLVTIAITVSRSA